MGGPGELDPLVRELIYIAVSATNGCVDCIASHRAAAIAKGMTEAMYGEMMTLPGSGQHEQSPGQGIAKCPSTRSSRVNNRPAVAAGLSR